jgi:phage repressor protein C with HTH and peptisase S24 domain
MTEIQRNRNNKKLIKMVNFLQLEFPVAEISERLKVDKGNLSSYLNNKKSVSNNFIQKFTTEFNLNIEEFNDDEETDHIRTSQAIRIPFYEDSIMMGGNSDTAEMAGISVHNEMIDAGDWFRDATGAMRVHGNSMYPNYPSGCIVAFKQVNDIVLLLYGQDYMIETSEYRVIKRIQKSLIADNLLLCSYNDEKDSREFYVHENFDVPLDKITRIFRILGKVERTESSRIVYNKV